MSSPRQRNAQVPSASRRLRFLRRSGGADVLLIAVLGGALLASGCSRGASGGGLTVAGSTSIQPFADHWAEIYQKLHPDLVVNVQGGGSSAGIQAARSGAAQIGMSSRELKPDEKDLTAFVVARDGLAVIVHPANPLDDIGLDGVRAVFAGRIGSWDELGRGSGRITVVTREEGSGTRGAFQEMVMRKGRIAREAIVEDSNGTVRAIVAQDPHAIGYISLGLVDPTVKALALDGVDASDANILAGRYALVRPFLFVTSGTPRPDAQAFLDFILSDDGQELVESGGLLRAR
ncbi:MAG: phosphate ABC transporter substrate-binding protein [Candidatus Aminicenantes bacterium]|nr:phosphate ABC transporter substrate-binding protein [Candidatus Aminicenantes bacterium]